MQSGSKITREPSYVKPLQGKSLQIETVRYMLTQNVGPAPTREERTLSFISQEDY